jgi:hypothetical protein
MRRFSIAFALAVAGVFLLSLPPAAWAQRARPRERIISVEPFDPFFPRAYPHYPYLTYNVPANYGQVKVETERKDASVYIDGGRRDNGQSQEIRASARRPRYRVARSRGQTLFHERVAVTVGNTTKLRVS